MEIKQARELLQRYQSGLVNSLEKELVESWYRQLVETGEWEWGEGEKEQIQQALESAVFKKIENRYAGSKVHLLNKRIWWAASIAIIIGAGLYFLLFNNSSQSPRAEQTNIANDVLSPQVSRAMITLANGQKIYLDSMNNGASISQGNVKLVKLTNGAIRYETNGVASVKMQYNTLLNPRGSKVINMLLADGTKVWLNAESSLVYPVTFTGDTREVSITGEAYFEVAHDKKKQFIVHKAGVDIIVMGTHFNVNAFEDDGDNIKVTLLEGAVKVKRGNSNGSLKPGQQALVFKEVKVIDDVNIEKVMAWKNGYFQFDKASLQSVLKQLARWYDVDVVYEGKNRSRQFVGEIERGLSLSEVLQILEINKVAFAIEGRKLIVKPD